MINAPTQTLRPVADDWTGPCFRTFLCGITLETMARKPAAFFLDAMEPGGEGVWIYTLEGAAICRIRDERHVLRPGKCLVVRKPSQVWLGPDPKALPWKYIWLNLTGEQSLRTFDFLQKRFGFVQEFLPDSSAVRAASNVVSAAVDQPHRSAAAWSRLTFEFLTAWWETVAAQRLPVSQELFEDVPSSKLLSFGPRSIKNFASQMGYSRQYLQKRLKEQWKQTPGRVLRQVRLEEAKRLLVSTNLSILEISSQVGYSGPTSFSRAFSAEYKVSPLAYRHSHR